MIYRLKNLSRAAHKSIRSCGKYKPYDEFSRKNDAIMKALYKQLKDGVIDYLNYLDPDGVDFRCYHRSPKYNSDIQYSQGFYRDGELIPCCDTHIDSFEKMCREGFPTGRWETGKVA